MTSAEHFPTSRSVAGISVARLPGNLVKQVANETLVNNNHTAVPAAILI